MRFKSRFTTDPASYEDVVRFVRGVLSDLRQSGALRPDDRFVVGCPAGWNTAARTRYRDLLVRAGVENPQVISESRAAFLYAKYARTVALDVDVLNEKRAGGGYRQFHAGFCLYRRRSAKRAWAPLAETALGGGLLDAALLRRAVERSRDRAALRSVLSESRSWYSYLEIEARRLKEDYFTRLATEAAPVAKKTLRVCYDGVQRLTLQIDNEEASHLVDDPLPELDGRSFSQAVSEALDNAARLTSERPPQLLLLTGGASRMPFFREACQERFPAAVVVSCPEPEFSIAKGLAYAGWVDENLRAFRKAIREEITDARVSAIASESLPALIPAVAKLLCDLIVDEAAIPLAQQWKRGEIRTLGEMNDRIGARVERILSSPLAEETLAPAVRVWLSSLTDRLQAMVDPICDRFEVPRRQMQLDLTATGAASVQLKPGSWMGLSLMGAVLGVIVSVAAGLLCGGGGIALIATGPLGFVAGVAVGAVASLLGWNAVSGALMRADVPLVLRRVNLEKRLRSESVRRELRDKLTASLSDPAGPFSRQVVEGFSRSFRGYVYAIAQAAEIPIA